MIEIEKLKYFFSGAFSLGLIFSISLFYLRTISIPLILPYAGLFWSLVGVIYSTFYLKEKQEKAKEEEVVSENF